MEVAKDVVRKDSCEAELAIVKNNLDITNENIRLKDSIITAKSGEIALYKEKEKNYELIIKYVDQQKKNVELALEPTQKELKKTKRKLAATQVTAGGVILFLSYIILRK